MSQDPKPFQSKLKTLVKTHRSLFVVLAVFCILGAIYNVSLPLYEAPDELAHFRYVNWLATEHRIPNVTTDLQTVGHEVGQAPLYYALLAPIAAVIDTADMDQIAPPNLYWHKGAGINAHYHTPAEQFPYRDSALAVHLARAATTLIACSTIISAYGIARLAAPKQAVLAAALVAFNPQFVFISSAVNNDNLITALSALTLLVLVWQLAPPRVPWWQYLLLGALWGLATLAKMGGLALGAVIALGLVLAAWRHRSWRPIALGGGCVLAGVAITAGWWFVRNWMVYGDPLAWELLLTANQGLVRPELLSWSDALFYATFLQRSFWAMFGYGLSAPTVFYQIVNGFGLLAFVGVVLWLVRTGRRRLTSPATLSVLLLIAWSLVSFVSLLNWMRQVEASNQGRLLFPAISSLAVLMALGLSAFGRRRNWLGLALMTFLLVWSVISPFLIIQPAYAQPSLLPSEATIPNPVPIQFGQEISLLGYNLPQPSVQAGESLAIELYWQALAPMSENYVVALHALDPAGQVVAGLDTIPYQARYPTAVWQPGQPFQDTYLLPIESGATPGQARLLLAVYPWGRPGEALPAMIGGTRTDDNLPLTTFKIAPGERVHYAPQNEAGVVFGRQAKLIGYDVPGTVEAGQPFTLTLYWEAMAPDGKDYTVFVHLLSVSEETVAQADGPPQSNWYPTSIWAPGEQIGDSHMLSPPGDAAAGNYMLVVGLYDPQSGQRLPAYGADGTRWPDDRVLLESVEFTEP